MKLVKYDTSPYMNEHNKQPRGRGYWAFQFENDDDVTWYPPHNSRERAILYSEAKRRAISKAHELGVRSVHLLP